jgi:5'/3'-nucleotidase
LFGLHSGEFGKPDLVLSGINWGDNSGMGSLLGSGTVGACWQAALEGIPSIAFSIARGKGDWHHKESWGDRKAIVEKAAEIVTSLKPELGNDKFFNVNMPLKLEGAQVVRVKRMQRERYGTKVEKRLDPEGRPYYWIIGSSLEAVQGTDVHEVMVKGNIAITEVSLSLFGAE